MSDELLDIREVAVIYRTTPASVRTQLWKHRRRGAKLRFPLPVPGEGELRWLRSDVDAHLAELKLGAQNGKAAAPSASPEPPAGRAPTAPPRRRR